MTTESRYYSTKTAAARLEVATVTVKKWCEAGKLPALKMGKLWKIPVRVVEERLLQAERTTGNILTEATR